MLLLTRRINEKLKIGDDIEIIIMGIKGNQVRLGINAPKKVPVHREEIYVKIQEEKEQKEKQEGMKRSTEETPIAIIEAISG